MRLRRFTIILVACLTCLAQPLPAANQPNIILVFIDDMGWGDFSSFGNKEAATPHIDGLAQEGIRFHQFYVNSPICSPSRVAISTGQYPHRHRITSYLADRNNNQKRGIANWLDPATPMFARTLQQSGYATAHCGKWHMGGQRDVDDAPAITAYGFDVSLTNFEGMGAKLLPLTEVPTQTGGVKKGRIWEKAIRLGAPVEWMLRSKITGGFADKAIAFIDQAKTQNQPFYINVWPDDVHTPLFPSVGRWTDTQRGRYLAVLEEMDQQLARLFRRIKNDSTLRDNTLILICSDNGPEENAGSAGPFMGLKATLFEGGLRSPLIVWGPGLIESSQQGTINSSSVFSAIDLVPSLLHLCGIPAPTNSHFDGENIADTLTGKSKASRVAPLFFRRPPDRKNFRSFKNLPDLAIRKGKWKLLCDYGGKRPRLHNLNTDPAESKNLTDQHPELTKHLITAILKWNATMPADAGDPAFNMNTQAR